MVKVTVIGAGNLGIKVAGELAFHGHDVRVYDRSPEVLEKVRLRIKEDQKLLIEDKVLQTPNFVGNIYYISRLEEAVKCSDFIFESVPEDLSLKQDLFEWISQVCRQDAVIATSTLNLSCDDVAERASFKERCIGIRFLFPVYCIPEVEIATGSHTSIATIEKVRHFLSRMGKIGFFRSGTNPFVLTEEERESKKAAFIQRMQIMNRQKKMKFRVPDLSNKEFVVDDNCCSEIDNDMSSREKDCVVCMDEERNCVLHPCHHLCTCCTCGRMLLKRQDGCPICRKPISSVFRIFLS